jgi:hypothetical protein
MAMTNTVAYYDTATVSAVFFWVQAQGQFIKNFSWWKILHFAIS